MFLVSWVLLVRWLGFVFFFLFFFSPGALKVKGVLSGLKHDTENSQHLKKEKPLKNLLQTLRYWQCSIFVPVVTLVLINHPNYLCYSDLCFWCVCFKCGIVLLHPGSSARQCRESSWGMFSLLEIFFGIFEHWTSFAVFYGSWASVSPKTKST